MNIIQTYQCKKQGKVLDDLTLLTQFFSVLKLKRLNPNSKIIFYTDNYTKQQYDKFKILDLYDEVNTDLLENFDDKGINYEQFWATPKLIVMNHQTEPYVMLDSDMVVHVPLEEPLSDKNIDVFFFHTEVSNAYPFPTFLSKPKGFEWTESELISFGQTLPFNCAIVGFNNVNFSKKYTDRYLEYVKGHSGLWDKKVFKEYPKHLHQYGAQVTAEQWLLSAMIYEENAIPIGNNILQNNIRSVSLTDTRASAFNFFHQLHNQPQSVALTELENLVFHLWGAKAFYEKGMYEEYEGVKNSVIEAITVEIEENWEQTLFDTLEQLEQNCREIPKSTN